MDKNLQRQIESEISDVNGSYLKSWKSLIDKLIAKYGENACIDFRANVYGSCSEWEQCYGNLEITFTPEQK